MSFDKMMVWLFWGFIDGPTRRYIRRLEIDYMNACRALDESLDREIRINSERFDIPVTAKE